MPDDTRPRCGARKAGGKEICGRVKGPANHWHLFGSAAHLFVVQPFAAPKPIGMEYACSEACVAGKLSRWMAKTTEASKGPPTTDETERAIENGRALGGL